MIFDVVYFDAKHGVIRSAFPITRDNGLSGTDRVLYFDKFWFVGPSTQEPVKLLAKPYSTPYPTGLDETKVKSLIGRMEEAGYREYSSGDTPSGVDADDWNSMIQAAQNALSTSKNIVRAVGLENETEAIDTGESCQSDFRTEHSDCSPGNEDDSRD